MSAIVLLVELKTAPGQRDRYVARAREHRGNVIANEPGCQRFDIAIPDEGDDRVYLYEVYTDEAALETHMNTEYMQQYRADTGPMIAERAINRCALTND